MDTLVEFKNSIDDFEVEFEILPAIDSSNTTDIRKANNDAAIQDIDDKMASLQERIDFLNKDIDRLTNHADGVDYLIAISSGIISGLLDAFFVGELGLFEDADDIAKEKFQKAKGEAHKDVNKFIEKYAKLKGYKGDGGLKGSIEYLEQKFPVAQDNIWSGKKISSAKTHHLDDLAHHPSLLGLVSAIMVQYLRLSIFSNKDGKITFEFVGVKSSDVIYMLAPIVLSGVIKWLVNLAEKKEILAFSDDVPKPLRLLVENIHKLPIAISILKTADNWFGHLVSDMGGSKNTAGKGAGIPGIFGSLLKEISLLPGLKNSKLPQLVNDLYQNTNNSPLTDKLDLRTEFAVIKEQSMPIIVNEIIVRSLYFIRHLVEEARTAKNITDIDWRKVIPFSNRTIIRMMTIATGTFTVVDLADAAIETAVRKPEACSNPASFFSAMILRVNFVGIGRFAIAITTDVGMGIKWSSRRKERIMLCNEQLQLIDAKMYYKLSNMWIAAEETGKTIEEAFVVMEDSIQKYSDAVSDICGSFDSINESIDEIVDKNPDFAKKMLEVLEW